MRSQNKHTPTRRQFIHTVASLMTHSKFVRVASASAIIGIALGGSYVAWTMRQALASVLAAMVIATLIVCGIQLAWQLLPLSKETRARWETRYAQYRELRARSWGYRWKSALWVGLLLFCIEYWRSLENEGSGLLQYLFPAVLVTVGVIASMRWQGEKS